MISYRASNFSGYYPHLLMQNAVVGDWFEVKMFVLFDLTLLYGAGHEPTSVAQFLAGYPIYDPTYDPGSLQSNKTAELRAYDGGNLRGSLQLNLSTLTSGGVVVFPDGMRGVGSIRDEVEGSTAIKRIGRVDLGALNWAYNATFNCFLSGAGGIPTLKIYWQGLCPSYSYVGSYANRVDKSIFYIYNNNIGIMDTSFGTDYAAFKAAMSGVYLDYELATPQTYTLDTPLPTDLTCVQGDILQRVSDNNCPFVGEMRFGL